MTPDPAHAFVPYPEVSVDHATQGPLAGLSFGVKDLFDVAGYPTGCGNPIMLACSGIKTRHAEVVGQLLAAGARFVGKCHTEEFAYSVIGSNPHFATPRNAAAPERYTGGSSSGSASAVGHRLCDFALGTDTAGSVRVPASHCGLFGMRPTPGRTSLAGCHPLAPGFDTCGFFTRDLDTFAQVLAVLDRAPARELPERPRIGVVRDAWALCVPQAARAYEPARTALLRILQDLGAVIDDVDIALDDFGAMTDAMRDLPAYEAWQINGPLIERHAIPMGDGVRQRHFHGRDLDPQALAAARAYRQRFVAHMDALLGSDRVLLMPTVPAPSPRRDEADQAALDAYRWRVIALTAAASLAGCPQLSLPLAGCDGGPMGISLLGPRDTDQALVALARRLVS
ncbi:MAG: amidase [Burkholderiaceae bacterium]